MITRILMIFCVSFVSAQELMAGKKHRNQGYGDEEQKLCASRKRSSSFDDSAEARRRKQYTDKKNRYDRNVERVADGEPEPQRTRSNSVDDDNSQMFNEIPGLEKGMSQLALLEESRKKRRSKKQGEPIDVAPESEEELPQPKLRERKQEGHQILSDKDKLTRLALSTRSMDAVRAVNEQYRKKMEDPSSVNSPRLTVRLTMDSPTTSLWCAAADGNTEHVERLLRPIDINRQLIQVNNATILHTACNDGNVDLIKMFLEVPGINVNLQDDNGNTPLHLAACKGSKVIVEMLLGFPGIIYNVPNNQGDTPLHSAAKEEKIESLWALIVCRDVDLKSRNHEGKRYSYYVKKSKWMKKSVKMALRKRDGFDN